VQIVAERDRRARREREVDVAPVFAGRVVDDGPALQQRLALAALRQHDAIRRLPHRRADDVADDQVVRVPAREPDRDVDLLEHALAGSRVEAALELHRDVAVVQRDALDLRQPHDGHLLFVEQRDLEVLLVALLGADRLVERLDEQDAAVHVAVCRVQRHPRAAQLVEHLGEAARAGSQRRGRRVRPRSWIERHRDRHRAAAGFLDDGERLQQIVHLVFANADGQRITIDVPGALEVADAVAIQYDFAQRQRAAGGGVRMTSVRTRGERRRQQ